MELQGTDVWQPGLQSCSLHHDHLYSLAYVCECVWVWDIAWVCFDPSLVFHWPTERLGCHFVNDFFFFFLMMEAACLIFTTLFDQISWDGISVPSWCGEVPDCHDFWRVKDMPNAAGALWRSCLTVTVLCHSTWMTWRGRTSASSSASTSWRRGYSRSTRRAVRMSTVRWVLGMQRAVTSACPCVWSVCVCVYVKSGLSEALTVKKNSGSISEFASLRFLSLSFCNPAWDRPLPSSLLTVCRHVELKISPPVQLLVIVDPAVPLFVLPSACF